MSRPPSRIRSLFVRFFRRARRRSRDAVDRLLHARRRQGALERLRERDTPGSVLFVCHGNINRSPFAAGAYAHGLEQRGIDRVRIRSAGFIGPGRSSPPETQRAAERYGFSLRGHRSTLVQPDGARAVDLVVVMDDQQRRTICRMTGRRRGDVVVLGDLDPERITRRAIQDPYGHADDVFERVYARVHRCIAALLDATTSSADRSKPLG